MATTKALKIEKLTRTVGAEVLDVDLGRIRNDQDLPEAVMDALEEHSVLVFRGLHIDDETQVAFCRKLGELVPFPGDVPEILVIAVDPEKAPHSELLKANVGWHIDGTVDEGILPKLSMLSAKVLSADGGDTEFASTYAAYDDLTEEEKERLATLQVHYCLEQGQRLVHKNPTPEQLTQWRAKTGEHPLVLTQRTGRKSLVIGHNAEYVVGMDIDEGRALITDLLARATVPDRVYRHVWSEGDTVVWDNRGVLHRATPYSWASQRELHRSQIFGDEY